MVLPDREVQAYATAAVTAAVTAAAAAHLETCVLHARGAAPQLPQRCQQLWQKAAHVLPHHHHQTDQGVQQLLTQRLITHPQQRKQHRQHLSEQAGR